MRYPIIKVNQVIHEHTVIQKSILFLSLCILIISGAITNAQTPPEQKPFIFPVAEPASASTWLLSQPYGNTIGAYRFGAQWYAAGQFLHFGIDVSMPCGTELIAVANGEVAGVDQLSRGAGPHNLILRFADLGVTVLYGHLLERPTVVVGQPVVQGEIIALSGDPDLTCDSRPHLHLEVRSLDYATAYNPVEYIDAPWHALAGVGAFSDTIFQQDLTYPRRWMDIADQPPVRFGATRLNNYRQPYPPPELLRVPDIPSIAPEPQPFPTVWDITPLTDNGCCYQSWWEPTDNQHIYVIDGAENTQASVIQIPLNNPLDSVMVQPAPPSTTSTDGTHTITYAPSETIITRKSDGQTWFFILPGQYPSLSPDNQALIWVQGDSPSQLWLASLDGTRYEAIWRTDGRASAQWIDNNRLLLSINLPNSRRNTTLAIFDSQNGTLFELGTWYNLRRVKVAPGGGHIAFYSLYNQDSSQDGTYVIATTPNASPQQLPWFADYRWRDAESLFYITYDSSDIHQLHGYNINSQQSTPLTDPTTQPFTVANGNWSVSPDGQQIIFHNALDKNLWWLRPR